MFRQTGRIYVVGSLRIERKSFARYYSISDCLQSVDSAIVSFMSPEDAPPKIKAIQRIGFLKARLFI